MSAIRASENRTERALRGMLHREGYRFRKYLPHLPGRPDFVFPREKVAVFVDGDYWHARVLREHGMEALVRKLRTPNRDYWIRKFQRRVVIDDQVSTELASEGWIVLRFWESELGKDVAQAVRQIAAAVDRRRRDLLQA